MADAELGVLLEPQNDLEDEIENPEVEAEVEGGRFAGRGGRSGVAGGGLAAVGALINPVTAVLAILTAILSQLRSVQQFAGGIFRTVQRKLAPLIASLIQFFRPTFSRIAEALANFDIREALSTGLQNITIAIKRLAQKILSAVGIDTTIGTQSGATLSQEQLRQTSGVPTGQVQPTEGTEANRPQGMAPWFKDRLDSLNPKTADRHDEEQKQVITNSFSQKNSEKTGGGNLG